MKRYFKLKYFLVLFIGIAGNCGLFLTLYLAYAENVEVTYKIEKNIIMLSLLFYMISLYSLSILLKWLFDVKYQKTNYYGFLVLIGLCFGNTLKTFILSAWIMAFKDRDVIYDTLLIRIKWLYTKDQLYEKIDKIYHQLKGINVKVTEEGKMKILEKSKDIVSLEANIKEYIEIEKKALISQENFNIFLKGLENIWEFLLSHPYITVGGIGLIALTGGCGLYYAIANYYTIQSIYSGLASLGVIGAKNREEIKTSLLSLKEILPHLDQLIIDCKTIKTSIKLTSEITQQIVIVIEMLIQFSPDCAEFMASENINLETLKAHIEMLKGDKVQQLGEGAREAVGVIRTVFEAFSGTGYSLKEATETAEAIREAVEEII